VLATTADFGDPVTAHDYELCIFDAGGNVLRAQAPAGDTCGRRPCWKGVTTGFSYSDKERTPEGVDRIRLTAGDTGKARILVRGKGDNLAMPALGGLVLPLHVQLLAEGGQCWEAAGVIRNDATQFKGKSD
jgi:hypothetical protein